MPTPVSYPGVYIEELPSGVKTITGVATALTAFLGRAPRGPVDDPVIVNSWSDYERIFGGLWHGSQLGPVVRDYFQNGGSQALIVRVLAADDLSAQASLPFGSTELRLEAREMGPSNLGVSVTPEGSAFRLEIVRAGETIESFPHLVLDPASPFFVQRVLEQRSLAVRVLDPVPEQPPTERLEDWFCISRQQFALETDGEPLLLELRDLTGPASMAVEHAADAADRFHLRVSSVEVMEELALTVEQPLPDDKDGRRMRVSGSAATRPAENTSPLTAKGQSSRKLGDLNVQIDVTGLSGAALVVVHDPDDEKQFRLQLTHQVTRLALSVKAAEDLAAQLESQSTRVRMLSGPTDVRPDEAADVTAHQLKAVSGDPSRNRQAPLPGSASDKTGFYALEKADLFTLLYFPRDDTDAGSYRALVSEAAAYCERRRAMLLLDAPLEWAVPADAVKAMRDPVSAVGTNSANAALYFPSVRRADTSGSVPAGGAIAGLFARTDAQRGIWKAPAGTEAGLIGAVAPGLPMTDAENGQLNPLGCNCIRSRLPFGTVVWGARTLQGNDQLASQWKYVPVRRLALYLEESLFRGTKWVVFEPNDEPLWAQIRLNVGTFLQNLFRQGAFQGASPREAYFVKCDHQTTTPSDVDQGRVNIEIGFAPLKPAEFVILKIQQISQP